MGMLSCGTHKSVPDFADEISIFKGRRRDRYLTELPDKLSAHPTRARWGTNVGCYGYGANVALFCSLCRTVREMSTREVCPSIGQAYLYHSSAQCNPLCTGANGVGGILNIRSLHHLTIVEQNSATDTEMRVRACREELSISDSLIDRTRSGD